MPFPTRISPSLGSRMSAESVSLLWFRCLHTFLTRKNSDMFLSLMGSFFLRWVIFFLENWISHPSERLSHIYPYRRLFSTLPHGGSLKSSLFSLLSLPCVLNRFSHVWLFATLWTIAYQSPLSMGFSRQEYWGGLPCPPPGDLPGPGIEPMSPVSLPLPVNHLGSPPKCI